MSIGGLITLVAALAVLIVLDARWPDGPRSGGGSGGGGGDEGSRDRRRQT